MEKEYRGMKPSYRIMKDYIKRNSKDGYLDHGTTLVYYCIKHDFNEEQVIDYLNKMVNNCEKLLIHHNAGAGYSDEYKIFKDILNISIDDFTLKKYVSFKSTYDYEKHRFVEDRNTILNHYTYYYNFPKDMHKKVFRDYNDHVVYLYDLMEKFGYCNHKIWFNKIYDDKSDIDIVNVYFEGGRIDPVGHNGPIRMERAKKEFSKSCLNLWHFIKLLDYSENLNDIDINELNKRKTKIDQVYDRTK
jgi:hypothetical protein